MAIERNPKLVAAGRKGGEARMSKLSKKERADLAKIAAAVRWANPIESEVIKKFKQMQEQIAADGKDQYFYFDGKQAWHSPITYLQKDRWAHHLIRCCTAETTMAEVVADVLST